MGLDANVFIEGVNKLKELSYLKDLDEDTINLLRELVNNYRNMKNNFTLNINIPEELNYFVQELDSNNIKYRDMDIDNIIILDIIIQKELKRLNDIRENLFNVINNKSIFSLSEIKHKLNNNEFLDLSEIFILRNNKNEKEIDTILNTIDILNNKNSNKESNLKKILYLEKKVIFDIEINLNFISELLGIDYDNKSLTDKYFNIVNVLNIRNNKFLNIIKQYKKSYDAIKMSEENISKKIEGIISLDNLKILSEVGFDKVLFSIRNNYRINNIEEYAKKL